MTFLSHRTFVAFIFLLLAACASREVQDSHQPPAAYFNGHTSRSVSSSGGATVVGENPQFDWPVDEARLTRGFLPNKRRPHLGLDLAAPKGTPILASRGGTVIYTGKEFRGFGKMILIESGDGWAALYAHLDKILITEGQKVRQGEVIGAMGRTGRATGVHLHFEIRRDRGPVDPLPLLPRTTLAAHDSSSSHEH